MARLIEPRATTLARRSGMRPQSGSSPTNWHIAITHERGNQPLKNATDTPNIPHDRQAREPPETS